MLWPRTAGGSGYPTVPGINASGGRGGSGRMRNYHRWTTTDHRKLREMWDRGYKIYEMAEVLGVTAEALASQCKRLKLPKRPPHQHRRRLRVKISDYLIS